MPFNDKGEFIRSEARPAPRSSPSRSTQSRSTPNQLHVVPPGSARVTSSTERPGQQRSQGNASGSDRGEVLAGILVILLGLAALAGVIWLVMAFYQWFIIGLVLWLISSLRKLFR